MSDYKIFNEKEKRKIFETVKKELSRFGIKSFLVYGSFVKRNYSKDLDLLVFDRISEERMNAIANTIEKKIKMEVDLRRFDELPEPIKYLAVTQGKGELEEKVRRRVFDFLRVYMDFVEWVKKWS